MADYPLPDDAWPLHELRPLFLADVSATESQRGSPSTGLPAAAGYPNDNANGGHKANVIHLTYNHETLTDRTLDIFRRMSSRSPPPYSTVLNEENAQTEHLTAPHTHSPNPSTQQVNEAAALGPITPGPSDYTGEREREREEGPSPPPSPPKTKHHPHLLVPVCLVAIIILVLVIMLPVYLTVIKPRTTHKMTVTGGGGSTVKASDGSTFTYNNKLGGICEFTYCLLIIFRRKGYVRDLIIMAGFVRCWGLFAVLSAKLPLERARASEQLFISHWRTRVTLFAHY